MSETVSPASFDLADCSQHVGSEECLIMIPADVEIALREIVPELRKAIRFLPEVRADGIHLHFQS